MHEIPDGLLAHVVDHAFVAALREAPHHVGTHAPQPNHAQLHPCWSASAPISSKTESTAKSLKHPKHSGPRVVHPHPPVRVQPHDAQRFPHPHARQSLADLIEHWSSPMAHRGTRIGRASISSGP